MGCIFTLHIDTACIIAAYTVMAYIVMDYFITAYTGMARIGMTYIVMAHRLVLSEEEEGCSEAGQAKMGDQGLCAR